MRSISWIPAACAAMWLAACGSPVSMAADAGGEHSKREVEVVTNPSEYDWPIQKSEREWRSLLTPEQFRILRAHGTEPACFESDFSAKEEGVYVVAGIQVPVFHSNAKYQSGSGWPSFFEPISPDAIKFVPDHSHGMVRTEVVDAQSGSHLGHVFKDGPPPTGLRYCINDVALEFIPQTEWERMQAEQAEQAAEAAETTEAVEPVQEAAIANTEE